MASFPTSDYSPRAIENEPGITYDSANKRTFFAEDLNNTNNEVVAISSWIRSLFTKYTGYLAFLGGKLGIGTGASTPLSTLEVKSSDGGIMVSDSRTGSWDLNQRITGLEFYTYDSSSGGPGVIAQILVKEYNEGSAQTAARPDLSFLVTDRADPSYPMEEVLRLVGISKRVGIGTSTPVCKLDVVGGIRLQTSASKPTCAVGVRGLMWHTSGAAGVKDSFEICAKDASDAYAWRTIY